MRLIKKSTTAVLAVLLAMVALAVVAGPDASASKPSDAAFGVSTGAPAPGDSGWVCPSGSFEDNSGMCRKPVADATVCPKATLGVPAACYVFVDMVLTKTGKACPSDSIQDTKNMCRKPVADAIVCPSGSLGVPGGCYIFVRKVFVPVLSFG